MRWSAAFIATCMVVIAASLAATAYLVLGFTGVEAIATALTVLAVLAAYNLFSSRGREDASLSGQISDLSAGTAQLAVQVRELGRRVGAVETAVIDAAAEARAAAAALLVGEIEELGALGGTPGSPSPEHRPRTPQGKWRSPRNARRHGLTVPIRADPAWRAQVLVAALQNCFQLVFSNSPSHMRSSDCCNFNTPVPKVRPSPMNASTPGAPGATMKIAKPMGGIPCAT
jgi:hypothetical protein